MDFRTENVVVSLHSFIVVVFIIHLRQDDVSGCKRYTQSQQVEQGSCFVTVEYTDEIS